MCNTDTRDIPATREQIRRLAEVGCEIVRLAVRDEKAVEAARQAVTIEPDSPIARNNLAVALYFKGDFGEAQTNMEKASELGYSVDPRFAQALTEKLGN
jgi:tetratricopeptide (TPR) repeat protein